MNLTNAKLHDGSILDRIFDHRRVAVEAQKQLPSQRPHDLQAAYDLNLAPPLVDFAGRVQSSPFDMSLMAETKRASPSKGDISLDICAPAQARTYATAGASVISVLTEPEWFKGALEDLRSVRQALIGMPDRPAVLRKDFIFDEYQILEARLAGADTVLLIVKMLDFETLQRLYRYSQTLRMEPLVEVNTPEEMDIAIRLGARVVGVNNRDLTSFEVNLDNTARLGRAVPEGTILCALSGISKPADLGMYRQVGVRAILVGEALMRAQNVHEFVAELLGSTKSLHIRAAESRRLLVKVCGTRSAEAAVTAIESGADMVGIILVKGRKRCVSTETGMQISKAVHETRKLEVVSPGSHDNQATYFGHAASHQLQHPRRALLVGVFQNQPLEYILEQQRMLDLDIVQVHGAEPLDWSSLVPRPVMHSFAPDHPEMATRGHHVVPLLDSGAGGTGQQIGTEKVVKALEKDDELRVMLAGGLNGDNVSDVISKLGACKSKVIGVDVSSGVETDGAQDLAKIKKFVAAAKAIELNQ